MVRIKVTSIREFRSEEELQAFVSDIERSIADKKCVEALRAHRGYFFAEKDAAYYGGDNYVSTQFEFIGEQHA